MFRYTTVYQSQQEIQRKQKDNFHYVHFEHAHVWFHLKTAHKMLLSLLEATQSLSLTLEKAKNSLLHRHVDLQ